MGSGKEDVGLSGGTQVLGKDRHYARGCCHRLRGVSVWGGCSPLCPVGRGPQLSGGVRAFQEAQYHPQISATCQEGLGDHRVATRAGTWAFLRFSIKNESIQGTCVSQGLQVCSCKKALHPPQPREEGPVTGPICQRKQGRPRGVR